MKHMRSIASVLVLLATLIVGACDREPIELASGEITLPKDRWMKIPIELDRSTRVQISLELTEGPAIDVYTVDEASMNVLNTAFAKGQYANMSKLTVFPKLGFEGLSLTYTSEWDRLSKGKYYVLIENMNFGKTAPPMNGIDDVAVVSYVIRKR